MADIRNDDLEDILAGMLDEQDRCFGSGGRRHRAGRGSRRSVGRDGGTRFPAGACRTLAYARRGCPEFCRPGP